MKKTITATALALSLSLGGLFIGCATHTEVVKADEGQTATPAAEASTDQAAVAPDAAPAAETPPAAEGETTEQAAPENQ